MFVIRWTKGNVTEKCSNQKEIEDRVSKVGTDGAILRWYDTSQSNGVIIYYNKIIGYVNYTADPLDANTEQNLRLNCALLNMTQDELIHMIKAYNNYILKVNPISDVKDKQIRDLFTWLLIDYLK